MNTKTCVTILLQFIGVQIPVELGDSSNLVRYIILYPPVFWDKSRGNPSVWHVIESTHEKAPVGLLNL